MVGRRGDAGIKIDINPLSRHTAREIGSLMDVSNAAAGAEKAIRYKAYVPGTRVLI